MKKIRFLIGVIAMALALVLVAVPAHAGSGSLAVAVDLAEVEIHNFNVGGVGNFIHTRANSGFNFTMFGGSGTGNAASSANVESTLNSNKTNVAVYDFESGPVAVNLGGEDRKCGGNPCPSPCWPFKCFDRVAIAADLTKVEVCNFNAGLVINGIRTDANSGHNFNFAGDSLTGSANASAAVDTKLNSNVTTISVTEGGTGPMAVNLGGRHALAVALEADFVKVKNVNLGLVANCVSTSANSGYNFTAFGSSDTGNATARSTVASTVNSSSTSVAIADGSGGPTAINVGHKPGPTCGQDEIVLESGGCMPAGGLMAANLGTGGIAVTAEVNAVDVSNVNVGNVYNNVDTSANTGNNVTVGCYQDPCPKPDPCEEQTCGVVSGDGEGTSSNTGNASATSTVTNTVNSNETTVVIGGAI